MSTESDQKWEDFRSKSAEFQRQRIKRLQETYDFLPPWKVFPQKRPDSGWKMGVEEDFWQNWQLWLTALNQEQRNKYFERHPEPPFWAGTYKVAFAAPPCTKEWDEFWQEQMEKALRIIESQIEIGKKYSE